jgi:hypothetical protein
MSRITITLARSSATLGSPAQSLCRSIGLFAHSNNLKLDVFSKLPSGASIERCSPRFVSGTKLVPSSRSSWRWHRSPERDTLAHLMANRTVHLEPGLVIAMVHLASVTQLSSGAGLCPIGRRNYASKRATERPPPSEYRKLQLFFHHAGPTAAPNYSHRRIERQFDASVEEIGTRNETA